MPSQDQRPDASSHSGMQTSHSHTTITSALPSRCPPRRSRGPRHSSPHALFQAQSISSPVTDFLSRTGYASYAQLFEKTELTLPHVLCLSNEELRDDVRINILAHRRGLLVAFTKERSRLSVAHPRSRFRAASVPEFGRILVHLSNVRTFHSWVRMGGQFAIFALAFPSLAPALGKESTARGLALGLVIAALFAQFYGAFRYWGVLTKLERKKEFTFDCWGVAGVLLLELAVAGVVGYVLGIGGPMLRGI